MATSLTAKPGEPSKNPFEHFAQSWKNLDDEHLFTYSSGRICETRSDFDKVESNLSTSFKERMLPTSFANHVLRALWGGFDRVTVDKEMNEKYMLGYFITYRHLLRDYSKRILTQKGDALRAWNGIATLLKRFSYGNEVSCGLPNAAMDLALLWTPVGDPLGSKQPRDERAEDGKEYYPTWSWTSMTDPVDLLVSQRWCAKGEGFVERLREVKDARAVAPMSKQESAVLSSFQMFLRQCSDLDLANRLKLSDQRPFESEVTWIGVQHGNDEKKFRQNRSRSRHLPTQPDCWVLHSTQNRPFQSIPSHRGPALRSRHRPDYQVLERGRYDRHHKSEVMVCGHRKCHEAVHPLLTYPLDLLVPHRKLHQRIIGRMSQDRSRPGPKGVAEQHGLCV